MEENGFHLNTDILETNLINIILLIALLIFSFAEPVKTGLSKRQARITEKLDTAANYLIMANFRHKESVETLERIRNFALQTKKEGLDQKRRLLEDQSERFYKQIKEEVRLGKELLLETKQAVDGLIYDSYLNLVLSKSADFK
uniref:ATP synthase CF0 subunit I n=1 Tax=Eustigmatophyceae sp. Chic 10/23 P-6w TaxID=1446905 RepID=A0A3R5T8S5_9STRA|nr:ATP synthase CF0 subunit I [Eustigmatophyceae sp. Chic 10/23 P-6w]QAA11566.1 ATP synthase CF0 subunit I [Eustigmatophyceae sp. Chic 10/23 P-6w]